MSTTVLTRTLSVPGAGSAPDHDDTIERVHLRTLSPSRRKQSRVSLAQSEPPQTLEEIPDHAVEAEDAPNGGYGWVCTVCVFLMNAHTWGVNNAWAIFLDYYLTHSTFRATRLEYALVGGLSISQSLLIAPVQALSMKHFGTRITLLIGTVLVFLALFTASFATEIWHLLLTQGVCFGWGMGFLYITATAVLPQWFSTKRSLAVGFASSGAGIGGLAYNLGTGKAVQTLGLAWSYRVLAFCSLGVNFVCAMLLKDRNKTVKPTQSALNWKEYTRMEVILISAWGNFTELSYITLLYSLPNYATAIGLSHSQGSVVGAMLNLGLAVGRPVIGYYSDSLGRINVATLITMTCGIFCFIIWIPATSYGPLLLFAFAAGICCGIFWGTIGPVTAEVVGLKRFPSVFGMVCLTLVPSTTFAEPIALEIVQRSGYTAAKAFVGSMYLLAAVSIWFLRSWQIHQTDQKEIGESARSSEGMGHSQGDFWLTPRRLFLPKRV